MMEGELYQLKFSSGKSYIGVALRRGGSRTRYKRHKQAAGKGAPQYVYRAWRKYGAPELITLAILPISLLFETEAKAIKRFGTLSPKGYNMTEGGESNFNYLPETKQKMAESRRRAWKDLKYRERITNTMNNAQVLERLREASRILWQTPSYRENMLAKRRDPEIRARISATLIGRPMPEHVKQIISRTHKGKKKTQASIDKIRAAKLARKIADPVAYAERCMRAADSRRGVKYSPEHCAKMSEITKRLWAEGRYANMPEALSRALKGKPWSEQRRKKMERYYK